MSPKALSILNMVAFTLNTLETAGVGPFSIHFNQNQDNATISARYQTIITPHGIAFSIWGIIFLMEGIFCAVTLFNERTGRSRLVVEGVSIWFVLACIAQTAWSPAFAYEKIPLSAFFMGCILVPLIVILVRQHRIISRESVSKTDYWLLQFPFEIHCGWICAAFALNLNIIGVALDASASTQVAVASVSLVVLAFSSVACIGLKMPQFTLPWVVVWATFWMSYELSNPKQSIIQTFSSEQIHAFFVSTRVLSGIIGLITLIRWVHYRSVIGKSLEESAGLLSSDGEMS